MALVPAYLGDEVDLVANGVVRTLEQLSFAATGGKYVVGMFESPMPATVNPLRASELEGWDTRPMTVEFCPREATRRVRGTKKISAIEGYRPANNLSPFYGYKSDPPTSKAFKETDPVGPVASSIKAAGELAACAELHGECADNVWKLLEQSWGVDASTIKDYVIPDISQSSERDVIKFVRHSSHSLYGFNADCPRVVTTGGSYKPESMSVKAYTDWHRIYISLRFIGNLAATYFPNLCPVGSKVAFAPAYIELPSFVATQFAHSLHVPPSAPVPGRMKALAMSTMKYYEGSMEAYGVAAYLRATHKTDVSYSEIMSNVDIVRAVGKKGEGAQIRVPAIAFDERARAAAGDVQSYSLRAVMEKPMVKVSKLKMAFRVGWRTASAMAYEAFFRSRSQVDANEQMRVLLRSGTKSPLLKASLQEKWRNTLLANIPSDIAIITYRLLLNGLPNDMDANAEFVDMLNAIAGGAPIDSNQTVQMAYANAVFHSRDLSVILSLIQTGLNRADTYAQGKKRFVFLHVPGREVSSVLEHSIKAYAAEKAQYWSAHYGSRVEESKIAITEASAAIKEVPRHVKAEFKKLGIEGKEAASPETLMYWDIFEALASAKKDAILYGFLKRAYPRTQYTIDKALRVTASLSVGHLRQILIATVRSYLAKRRTWGKDLAAVCEKEAEVVAELDRRTRHHDMLSYLDTTLTPVVSFVWLYQIYLRKMGPATNSIQKMIRAAVHDVNDEEELEDIEKDWDTKLDDLAYRISSIADKGATKSAEVPTQNLFSALYESDSDSVSSDDNGLVALTDNETAPAATLCKESDIAIGGASEGASEAPDFEIDFLAIMAAAEENAEKYRKAKIITDRYDIREFFAARYSVMLSDVRVSRISEKMTGDPNGRYVAIERAHEVYDVYRSLDFSDDVAPLDTGGLESIMGEFDIAK